MLAFMSEVFPFEAGDKKRGAAAPLFRFSLAVPTDQNFTTTVPLTVRGAPI